MFLYFLGFVIVATHKGNVFGLSFESRERIIADAVICEPHKHGAKIPNPIDCSSFYVCDRGVPELMLCDAGLLYDIHLQVCNWPEHTTCVYGSLPEKPAVGQESNGESIEIRPANPEVPEIPKPIVVQPMPNPDQDVNDLDSSSSIERPAETPAQELPKPPVAQPVEESPDISNEQPDVENLNQHPSQEEQLPFPAHPIEIVPPLQSSEGNNLPEPTKTEQEFPEQQPIPTIPVDTKPIPENSNSEHESKPFEPSPPLIPNSQGPFLPSIANPQAIDNTIIYPSRIECIYDGIYYLPHQTTCEYYYMCLKGILHENYCGSNLYWDYINERCEAPQTASCYSQLVASGNLAVVPGTPGWGQIVPNSKPKPEENNHHYLPHPDGETVLHPVGNGQVSKPEQHPAGEGSQHPISENNQPPKQASSIENNLSLENQGQADGNSHIKPAPLDPVTPGSLNPIIPGGIMFPHPEPQLPTVPSKPQILLPPPQNTYNPAPEAALPLNPKPIVVRPPIISLSSGGISAKDALSSASHPHPMDGYDPEHVRCIHEGIYFLPHPTNCEIYFICINHTMHLHRCGYNIHWDYITNQCSAPAPHRCYAFRDNAIVEEETAPSVVKQPKPKDPMEGYDAEYIRCIHPGFYYLPHPTSCTIFFVCSNHTLNIYQCNIGSSWDYTEEQCTNLHNKCYSKSVPIAPKTTTMPSTTPADTEHDLSEIMQGYDPKRIHCLHNGKYYLPHPALCQLYFMCANRTLSLHECPTPSLWNYRFERCDLPQKSTCFDLSTFGDSDEDDETTSKSTSPTTTTTTTTTTTPAPTTTTSTTTSTTTTTTTPKPKTTVSVHMPFEVDDKDANAADDELDILPKCPRHQAFYPHSKDCRKYYICIGGVPILTKCPDNLYWDPQQRMCGLPSHTKCVINRKA